MLQGATAHRDQSGALPALAHVTPHGRRASRLAGSSAARRLFAATLRQSTATSRVGRRLASSGELGILPDHEQSAPAGSGGGGQHDAARGVEAGRGAVQLVERP